MLVNSTLNLECLLSPNFVAGVIWYLWHHQCHNCSILNTSGPKLVPRYSNRRHRCDARLLVAHISSLDLECPLAPTVSLAFCRVLLLVWVHTAWWHWHLAKPLDYTHCTSSIDCVWVCECIIATQCCGSIATIPITLLCVCVCHNTNNSNVCVHCHHTNNSSVCVFAPISWDGCWLPHCWKCDNCWAQLVWPMCIWWTYKHWTRTISMIISNMCNMCKNVVWVVIEGSLLCWEVPSLSPVWDQTATHSTPSTHVCCM